MKGKNAAYPKVIDQMKASEELSKSVELRQNKYLNNLIEQDHRFPGAIDQTRDGISFVQYGSPSLKRIRGDEHANALDKLWESKKEMFWLVQNTRAQIFGVAA